MKIIKSFRKTLSMKMDETGDLIIKAPYHATKKSIQNFVDSNKKWVEEKKKNVMERYREFKEWEKFYYFWEQYVLKFDAENEKMYFDWMTFYLHKKHKKLVKEKLIEFYKEEARAYIKKRAEQIALINKVKFNWIKITSAKTRWGSCTSNQNINFTYRLIMAPNKVIDYVIVHELAHLKEMNHSKKFWDLVEKMSRNLYPWDYTIQKKWLNDNGNKLMY